MGVVHEDAIKTKQKAHFSEKGQYFEGPEGTEINEAKKTFSGAGVVSTASIIAGGAAPGGNSVNAEIYDGTSWDSVAGTSGSVSTTDAENIALEIVLSLG